MWRGRSFSGSVAGMRNREMWRSRRDAIYAVLRHHGVAVANRSTLARDLQRYSEHEVHGFFLHRAATGHTIAASIHLLRVNTACIEWEQAMGGKPQPWGKPDWERLAEMRDFFDALGLSRKMSARTPTHAELHDRRLVAKQGLIRQMLEVA